MKKYIVELIGAFALTLIVSLSVTHGFPAATPVLAGLTLMLFVYSVGHISGSHINPAVTLGIFSLGKIRLDEAVYYIIAQCIGAVLATVVATGAFNGSLSSLIIVNSSTVFFAEVIGAFFFCFGIASVLYSNVEKTKAGGVIGGSLFLGIALAVMLGSNGILNPAVALGLGSFNLAYVLGPIVGSVLGMQVYKMVDSK